MALLNPGPRIYNIFPRLVGPFETWNSHLDRIRDLGFNWVYINPFHYPGFSGSLYAPKDYYAFNPLFIDESSKVPPMKQLENMLEEAHKRGLKVMMDLVINHSAKDHPFTKSHESWYKRNDKGEVISPGAWDNGQYIEWGDLGEIDNENSKDKVGLWKYWRELVLFYIERGFDGYRADAAYQVPVELWEYLITAAKKKSKSVQFFAETLGCPLDQTISLGKCGFDYIFNSSKWWNYRDSWLLDHYKQTSPVVPSIAFPESHDTQRLSLESKNDLALIKQRTAFTAFYSTGWMVPIGFEFGFQKKPDVVHTYPKDWESPTFDLCTFIKAVNETRASHKVFNEEGPITKLKHPHEDNVLILKKETKDGKEIVLIMINSQNKGSEPILFHEIPSVQEIFHGKTLKDLSIEYPVELSNTQDLKIRLAPYELKLILVNP